MASKGWRTNKYCKVKKGKEFQATLFYVRRVLYVRTGMMVHPQMLALYVSTLKSQHYQSMRGHILLFITTGT